MASYPGAGADSFIYRPAVENFIPIIQFVELYWDHGDSDFGYWTFSFEGLALNSYTYIDKGYLTGNNLFWPTASYSGTLEHSFAVDYYNRIHVNPNPVDFGAVLDETTLQVEVWNAFFEDSVITDYTVVNFTGIEIDPESITPPDITIPALYNHVIPITANLDGPAVLAGQFQVIFEPTSYAKPTPVVDVLGRRAKLFPFATSWQKDPIDRMEWRTNILETDTWEERRFRLRQWPRRSLQLGMGAVSAGAADLRVALMSAQPADYALPLWMYDTPLVSEANPGDTRIYVNTLYNNFQVGGSVMVYDHPGRFETLEITVVEPTYLDLNPIRAVSQKWLPGTTLYPIRLSRIDPHISMEAASGNALVATVNFETLDQEVTFDGHPFPQYLGYPRIDWVPNWISGRKLSYQRKIDVVDMGVYPKEYHVQSLRHGERQEFEWFLNGRINIYKFKNFMQYLSGRCYPTWVPSWQEDFKLIGDYFAGQTDVTVQGNFASKFLRANIVEPVHVRIRLKDGREYADQLISADTSPDNSANDVIRLKIGFADDFTNRWVDNFCLLTLVRMAADSVDVVWKTPEMAISKTTFVYVPNQPE